MSLTLDKVLRARGTRFLLYPQAPVERAFAVPEVVWVSPPPGSIGPGPSDSRMYVVNPIRKARPYEYPYMPPYSGPAHPRSSPDSRGHFDYLKPGMQTFNAAHMYGCVRRVLDVWEDYFGRPITWHFRDRYERLELIPFVDWDNAQSGYGFLEAGYNRIQPAEQGLYCLNFDVLAHEIGHSIVYSEVGIPADHAVTAEYRGFHEAMADLVALIAATHFDAVVDRVLHVTAGNLYTQNEIDRIGELSETEQIRSASNSFKMSDVADVRTPSENLCQSELHHIAEPLTGAVFDILVEVYQEMLVERALIGGDLAALSYHMPANAAAAEAIQSGFDRAYAGRSTAFKNSLLCARDYVGRLLALTLSWLRPDFLTYRDVARAMLAADQAVSGGRCRKIIEQNLTWREIPVSMARQPSTAIALADMFFGRQPRQGIGDGVFAYSQRWELARRFSRS